MLLFFKQYLVDFFFRHKKNNFVDLSLNLKGIRHFMSFLYRKLRLQKIIFFCNYSKEPYCFSQVDTTATQINNVTKVQAQKLLSSLIYHIKIWPVDYFFLLYRSTLQLENMKTELCKALSHMLQFTDFFYSSQMLRFHGEEHYKTKTGGIFSLMIITTIVVGFASRVLDTIRQNNIVSQLQVTKSPQSTSVNMKISPQSNFMFGIQVWHQNLSQPNRLFDVIATLYNEQYGNANTTILTLQPCTIQHWDSLPEFRQKYDKLGMSGWLCPPIGTIYELFGKYTSAKYQQVQLQVAPCKLSTDPSRPCADQSTIDQMWSDNSNGLYFTFYFINTVINPGEQDGVSFYLEDLNYVMFSKTIGAEAYLYITDFFLSTDMSIMPFENIIEEKGFIAEQQAVQHTHIVAQGGAYVNFYLAKSPNSLVYTRTVSKISDVLSFMGGMIGALSALLFILNIYTNFSFQTTMALAIFTPDDDDPECKEKKELHMNFLLFIKYSFWFVLKKLGCQSNNSITQYVHDCRSEIMKQLDIHLLIRRITLLQYAMTYLLEDLHLQAMQLHRPNSLESIRQVRQKLQNVKIDQLSDFDYLSKVDIIMKQSSIIQSTMVQTLYQKTQKKQPQGSEEKSQIIKEQGDTINVFDTVIEMDRAKIKRQNGQRKEKEVVIQDISENDHQYSSDQRIKHQTYRKTKNLTKLLQMNDQLSLKLASKIQKTNSIDSQLIHHPKNGQEHTSKQLFKKTSFEQ